MNLFWLIFAHFVADIPLQPEEMVRQKNRELFWMIAHCFIYAGCISFTLQLLGLLNTWKIPFLFFGHMIIDYWKIYYCCNRRGLYFDQILHLIQLIIIL